MKFTSSKEKKKGFFIFFNFLFLFLIYLKKNEVFIIVGVSEILTKMKSL